MVKLLHLALPFIKNGCRLFQDKLFGITPRILFSFDPDNGEMITFNAQQTCDSEIIT